MIQLLSSVYNNIQGVMHIHSGKNGPIFIISCLTHGDETAGLKAIEFLYNKLFIKKNLLQWHIYFVLNNIKAYENYLSTGDSYTSRYVDENMNKSANEEDILWWETYETKRLQELYSLFSQANYHIDLHSTSQSPVSMAIYSQKSRTIFQNILNVDEHYSGIIENQRWKPVIDICERNGGIWLWLESGREDNDQAYYNMIDNVLRILYQLHMIDHSNITEYLLPPKENIFYNIYDKIYINNIHCFHLNKNYNHGDFINKWDCIAIDNGVKIISKEDSIVIMPAKTPYSNEEYCFLARTH